MTELSPHDLSERYRKAKLNRSAWESHWQECYDFALPHKGGASVLSSPGAKRTDKLFDGSSEIEADALAEPAPLFEEVGIAPAADDPEVPGDAGQGLIPDLPAPGGSDTTE